MKCNYCGSKNLTLSRRSQRWWQRVLWLLILCCKMRCHDCHQSQIRFLPEFWLSKVIP